MLNQYTQAEKQAEVARLGVAIWKALQKEITGRADGVLAYTVAAETLVCMAGSQLGTMMRNGALADGEGDRLKKQLHALLDDYASHSASRDPQPGDTSLHYLRASKR